jgi:hypothetical protein
LTQVQSSVVHPIGTNTFAHDVPPRDDLHLVRVVSIPRHFIRHTLQRMGTVSRHLA